MTPAAFRSLCHSLGLSARAVAQLCAVQERTVRHWFADGEPPEGVLAQVMAIDHIAAQQVDAALAQAEALYDSLPPGADRPEVALFVFRDETAWHAAHPEFAGLPIQAHSMMLRRVWEALQGMGYPVVMEWAE